MPKSSMRVVVLVKAAPVMTSALDETMCVAAARVDEGAPTWVRLHPVPFRDLQDDERFAKYQELTVDVGRPKSDRRPESRTPIQGTLRLGRLISPDDHWAERRQLVDQLFRADMCDLVERNREGSGPGTPSLAVVEPADVPELLITERDQEQLRKWRERAEAAASRVSLFEDPSLPKPPMEVIPWRFRYKYRCGRRTCSGHEQTIVDWEAAMLWRRVRYSSNWKEQMRTKFVEQMWTDRSTVLFVGNQEQYPASFLVLGVFWPPAKAYQPSLLA